jgi:NAD(P)H-dependent flavin oxidoreductase YrpB (nitropropane dioxygenase family)
MQIERAAEAGNEGARDLLSYWVGQGVGLVDTVRSAEQVVADFMADFATAAERVAAFATA